MATAKPQTRHSRSHEGDQNVSHRSQIEARKPVSSAIQTQPPQEEIRAADKAGAKFDNPRPSARDDTRSSLAGPLSYVIHGCVFLSLSIVGVIYFGNVFLVISAVVALIALFSLWQGVASLTKLSRK